MPSEDDDYSFVEKTISTPIKSGPSRAVPLTSTKRTGPLTDGTTLEVVYKDTVVGHVFSCSSSIPGVTQEQRWILHEGYCPLPRRGVSLRWAKALVEPITTLDAWKRALNDAPLWKAGATYVMTSVSSTDTLEDTKAPPFLCHLNELHQVDDGMPQAQGVVTIALGDTRTGYVFGSPSFVAAEGRVNTEHWILLPSYASPRSQTSAELLIDESQDQGHFTASRDFLRFADSIWEPGSTHSVASCVYLSELPPDL